MRIVVSDYLEGLLSQWNKVLTLYVERDVGAETQAYGVGESLSFVQHAQCKWHRLTYRPDRRIWFLE